MSGPPVEILPIHPFPARMAPEIALAEVAALPASSLVLDPMAGSGTVIRVAAETGHRALGFDLDPLAVLIARVWTTPIDVGQIQAAAAEVIERAGRASIAARPLPWIDADPETRAFVDYWFAEPQQSELRRLAAALAERAGPVGEALRVAFSRLIVTKDHGASLARDVSHSRPHRVRRENDFRVLDEFRRSVARLAARLAEQPPPGRASVMLGDARRLSSLPTGSIDAVITSPPYLNALDYLRGHRLALVWLGYRLADLRRVRAASIGAERGPEAGAAIDLGRQLAASLGSLEGLPRRQQRMVVRYVLDLHDLLAELFRVLRPGGTAVVVTGNSCLRGVAVRNAAAVIAAAQRAGFTLRHEAERPLPPNRRYLPPPGDLATSALEKRLRSETVLSFTR